MKVRNLIERLGGRTAFLKATILDVQFDAFQPDPEEINLLDRNAGQIGRLIRDTRSQLESVDTVIADAKALRSDIVQSLAAWEAAGAVLEAPHMPLATRIKDAAEETSQAAAGVVKSAGKARKLVLPNELPDHLRRSLPVFLTPATEAQANRDDGPQVKALTSVAGNADLTD